MLPAFVTVSARNAKTNPFGIVAPRRFSMIGCGIATTSALTLRVPGGHATTCGGGAVVGAAGSDSGLVSSLVVAVGVMGSGGAALDSTVGFSTATVGVCAASVEAVIKIRVIAANEVTKYLGVDLKPCIYFSFFAFA
jgi:hypothetical protein